MTTAEEKDRDSRSDSAESSQNPQKSGWDKAEIIFKLVGPLLVGLSIGGLGWFGNNVLQEQQKKAKNMQLYTQLLSNKEAAENSLRKDMFSQILLSFLTPKDTGNASKQPTIARIREMRLSLDLLSRNFHESLDMKPLFKHLLIEIVRSRRILKNCLQGVGDKKKTKEDVRRTCEKIKKKLNEDLNIEDLAKLDEHVRKEDLNIEDLAKPEKHATKDLERLVRRYDRELDLLIGTAKRVARKQREVLEEVAEEMKLEIRMTGEDPSDVCEEYRPTEWLPKADGICKTKKGGKVSKVLGVSTMKTLAFKHAGGENDSMPNRFFRMRVRYIYPKWNQVFVEILTCLKEEEKACEKDPERDEATFWLEHFDFPLVDSTYLNATERYSVILEGFKRGPAHEPEKADITLLYYPASYAGLKEKSFYNNQLMQSLLESDLFEPENKSDSKKE